MPFNCRSTDLFSSAIALSTLSVVAEPVVTPSTVFGRPEDCAVPALLVRGGDDNEMEDGRPLPVPWATVTAGASRITIVASTAVADNLHMEILPCGHQRARQAAVPAGIGAMQFAQADRV